MKAKDEEGAVTRRNSTTLSERGFVIRERVGVTKERQESVEKSCVRRRERDGG